MLTEVFISGVSSETIILVFEKLIPDPVKTINGLVKL
jgi:hypothetical protein